MSVNRVRTYSAKESTVTREWILIDASGIPIGRLASAVARILQGKHKPTYTRHVDTGDAVVIINAEQVKATGSKEYTKLYYRHSGRPGSLKEIPLEKMRMQHPTRILEEAVRRMISRTPLGRNMFRKLHVYAGSEHPHAAQQPRLVEWKNLERSVV